MNIIRIIWLAAKNIQPVDILFEFYSTNSKDTEEIIDKCDNIRNIQSNPCS